MRLSPTPRAAALLALVACSALVLPAALAVLAALALLAAIVYDARSVPDPGLRRDVSQVLSRGVRQPLTITAEAPGPALQVRQPAPGGLAVEPAEGDGGLDAELLPIARGGTPCPGSAVASREVSGSRPATRNRAGEPRSTSTRTCRTPVAWRWPFAVVASAIPGCAPSARSASEPSSSRSASTRPTTTSAA